MFGHLSSLDKRPDLSTIGKMAPAQEKVADDENTGNMDSTKQRHDPSETEDLDSREYSHDSRVLSLPNELLVSIFKNLQRNQNHESSYHIDIGTLEENHRDIENVRLTCRRFAETSSHLLMSHISIELTPSSMQRFDEVSRRSSISSGIRAVRVYVHYFSRSLSDDLRFFVSEAARRLERQTRQAAAKLLDQAYWNRTQKKYSMDLAKQVIHQAQVTATSWQTFSRIGVEDPSSLAKILRSSSKGKELLSAWEAHKKCQSEQSELLEGKAFVKALALALARMPKATRMLITDDDWRHYLREITLQHLIFYSDEGRSMSDLIDSMMLQTLKWGDACHDQSESGPTALLSSIPVALQEQGVFLTALNINVTPSADFDLRVRDQDISTLSRAAQNLRHFAFSTPLIDTRESRRLSGAAVISLRNFLSGMLNPRKLEDLSLSFPSTKGGLEPASELGRLLIAPPAWPELRTVSFVMVRLDLPDFQDFVRKTGSSPQETLDATAAHSVRKSRADICLRRVHLESESLADMLDFMRDECGPASQMIFPVAIDVPKERYFHAFYGHDVPPYNRATDYIQRRSDHNPLLV